MKYIGIVSRVHGINYGANLQAVALQTVIQKIGANTEYINYEVAVPTKSLKKQILSWGYGVVRQFLGFRKRLKSTQGFQDKYLCLSPKLLSKSALQDYSRRYDLLMAGSDQIWNPRYYPLSDGLYLLSFIDNCRKVSYASSFGVFSLPNELRPIYQTALKSFDTISVRERDGHSILEGLGFEEVNCHIDPTLLLSANEWKQFFDTKPLIEEPYICCYVMSGANELNEYIYSKAKEFQKEDPSHPKIVILGEKEYKGLCSHDRFVRTAGPSEFLNYIYNACYVLTSSFHGTCFSVIFNKNFYTVLTTKNKFNSRMTNLLTLLGLDDRIYYKEDNKMISGSACSFEVAMNKLKTEQDKSLKYLKEIIK